MDNQLKEFVDQSRSHGMPDTQIKSELLAAGWPAQPVDEAMGTGSAVSVPQYHPHQTSNFGMWVVFEYTLMFITLAFSATGLAGLLHHLVDNKIAPISASNSYLGYYDDYLVKFYIATLVIAFPIFGYLALKLRARLERFPEIRTIKIRKVFIYIALTWTFFMMLVRLIETVYGFLDGKADPMNLILNLIVTLLICGSIFTYFVFEIKQDGKN